MYHRVRRKMIFVFSAILVLTPSTYSFPKSLEATDSASIDDGFDNNIIDFDEEYSVTFNKKYGLIPWHSGDHFNKESHRYIIVKEDLDSSSQKTVDSKKYDKKIDPNDIVEEKINGEVKDKKEAETKRNVEITTQNEINYETTTEDFSVIPLELITTTENILVSIIESTTEQDLTVIPLSTTKKAVPNIETKQTVTLPSSTENIDTTTEYRTTEKLETTTKNEIVTEKTVSLQAITENVNNISTTIFKPKNIDDFSMNEFENQTTNVNKIAISGDIAKNANLTDSELGELVNTTNIEIREKKELRNVTKSIDDLKTNSTKQIETINRSDFTSTESDEDVPIFTELDVEDQSEVPDDYYDSKDVVPTKAPNKDALSVIFGLAGSVVESMVESVAERVVPKGIFDLFKRMQRQSEALESERLRSREENGGLGQFGRGILKTISSGLSKPLSQLMAGVRDIGSLDNDRGFVGSLASGVASGVTSVATVANTVVDAFKDRVQAIYPGTVWCGDGRSATARSSDLGLFFFTDTCCRQHDACKLYIKAGDTKYGLTNTGLFTRSHCSCDVKFRECLRRTNSLVSAQIGLTYFNVLGPQCFRRTHPIVRCVRRTRITGQKCEEYELDYTKPKMWQWFDNETF